MARLGSDVNPKGRCSPLTSDETRLGRLRANVALLGAGLTVLAVSAASFADSLEPVCFSRFESENAGQAISVLANLGVIAVIAFLGIEVNPLVSGHCGAESAQPIDIA
jgi:hypothetical protein